MELTGQAGALGGAQGWSAALRGEQVASAEGITVAVSGRPLQRTEAGTWIACIDAAVRILESYRQRGVECLQTLGGRFALAITDTSSRRAILAIDPLGVERLAWSFDGNVLHFGTSAADVAARRGRATINRNALLDYLMLHVVPAPETIFAGVRKLRGGTCVVLENGTCRESPWKQWRFNEESTARPEDFEPLRRRLFESLREGVRECEPGDRTGAFLSGGLDSSTVAGLLGDARGPGVATFTIGFGIPEYDEFPYSRIANARFGCTAHEYVVQPTDAAKGFAAIARAYDEPFGNSSALAVWYCARLARDNGMDHLLAGDGGDELFAGNSRYSEQDVFERYQRVPGLLRTAMLEPALRLWPEALDFRLVRKARSYIEKANIPLPARLEAWNFLQRTGVPNVLHPELLRQVDAEHTFHVMQELWNMSPARTSLNRMLTYDWQLTLADNDIRKVSGMCALAGMRVSYPMLHPDVVQLSTEIPPGMKMPGTRLRDFYKRAMTGFLPDEIIHKKKHGFSLPFGLWLKSSPELHDRVYENLRSLLRREIINPAFLDKLLVLHDSEDARYYGVFVWVLAMLEQWLSEHRLES